MQIWLTMNDFRLACNYVKLLRINFFISNFPTQFVTSLDSFREFNFFLLKSYWCVFKILLNFKRIWNFRFSSASFYFRIFILIMETITPKSNVGWNCGVCCLPKKSVKLHHFAREISILNPYYGIHLRIYLIFERKKLKASKIWTFSFKKISRYVKTIRSEYPMTAML